MKIKLKTKSTNKPLSKRKMYDVVQKIFLMIFQLNTLKKIIYLTVHRLFDFFFLSIIKFIQNEGHRLQKSLSFQIVNDQIKTS